MIFIAHRGNLIGPNPEKENHPDYVTEALEKGFHVEVDVWMDSGKVFLGHDGPTYEATEYFGLWGKWNKYNHSFIDGNPTLWVHCKNFEALADHITFLGHKFTHDQDDFTLTSTGYIWTYPRNLPLSRRSIAVMPERVVQWDDLPKAGGICTDFPIHYQIKLS